MSIPNYNGYKIFDMIVAADLNWGIGYKNNLLVKLPEDMEFFKSRTEESHIMIMGSNTQKSLPMGYLPGRVNIVMTSKHTKPDYEIQNTLYSNTDIVLVNSLSQIFDYLRHHNNKNYKPIVIGGASIYQYFLNYDLIERIFLTRIRYKFENVDTGIDNLYEAGFDCHTNHPLFIPTDYSSWTKSTKTYKDEDGNEKPYEFYIHTLTKT